MAVDKLVDSTQLDADLTSVANAIRTKGGTSAQMAFPSGFVSAVNAIPTGVTPTGTKDIYKDGVYDVTNYASANVDTSSWHKPDAWPDIESVPLPGSYVENTWYILYDRSIGYDAVKFNPGATSSAPATIYKGTVVNGAFVGEQVATVASGSFEDTLTEDYTVYKVSGGGKLSFAFGGTTYMAAAQSIAWLYGECPASDGWGSHSADACLWGIYTQRVKVQHIGAVPQSVYLTLPETTRFSLKSLWLGYDREGDFNGFPLDRTGNGPVYTQSQDYDRTVVIQNVQVRLSVGRFSYMKNVIFKNVTGTMVQQAFQSSSILRYVKFEDCDITATSNYYIFNGCQQLTYCDLSSIDFTGLNQGATFGGCVNLETLILNSTWDSQLNLNSSPRITHDSLVGIFNVLPTISEARTITLHVLTKAYTVSAEEIAIVTAKGWTVA